ncbi:MAG: RidA family protein [Acidobacteria bacterium]|nr:RidA family protein [Acidobacteriota bacterium]
MPKKTRRTFLTAGLPALAVGAPAAAAAQTPAGGARQERRFFRQSPGNPPPPYSPEVAYGNLLFISGKGVGAGFQGDITAQVTKTIDNVEESLKAAGSALDKVLKVNVYLADIRHFDAMNAVYRQRFGPVFPTRTTIGGVVMPDGGLVEIDCVAYI